MKSQEMLEVKTSTEYGDYIEPICVICGNEPPLKCHQCGADICKKHGFLPEAQNMLRTRIQNALRYANIGHIFYDYYPNWEGVICKTCLIHKFDVSIQNAKSIYSDYKRPEGARRKIVKVLSELKMWREKTQSS